MENSALDAMKSFYSTGVSDIESFEKSLDGEFGEWITNNNPEVERRSDLSPEQFFEEYFTPQKPVIIENAMKNWPAQSKWTWDYFQQKCGDTKVTCNIYDSEHASVRSIGEVIAKIKLDNAQEGEFVPYIQEWSFQTDCPELAVDVPTLPYYNYDNRKKLFGSHNQVLWIGGIGSRTRMHVDFSWSTTFHAQFTGSKKWFLLGPNVAMHFMENGLPDIGKIVEENLTKFKHTILKEGDILFIPCHCWHRVRLIENCIAMSIHTIEDRNLGEHLKDVFRLFSNMALNGLQIKEDNPKLYERELKVIQNACKLLNL